MPRSIDRPRLVAFITLIALASTLLFATSRAQAATVYACVKKKGGAVHLVSKHAKCKHGETKLSWGTAGPAGAAGPQGSPGSTGGRGETGSQGPGAQRIEATESGNVAFTTVATVGLWTVQLACENGSVEHIKFTGPGSYANTALRSAVGGSTEGINNDGPIGAGTTLSGGANTQYWLTTFLFAPPSLEQVTVEFWDSATEHTCTIVGEAIPAS